MNPLRNLLILSLAVWAISCGQPTPPPPPHVVVLSIDTIRADALGCYGSEKGLTPELDALAARGVRFADAIAPMATTFPSHSSMFTGLYPRAHGVRWNGDSLGEEHLTLAELLQMDGYATGGFVSYKAMIARGGLKQGFDVVSDAAVTFGKKTHEERIRSGAEVNQLTFEYLDSGVAEGEKPVFLWLHYFEPHSPYPMTDYAKERLNGYDGPLADGASVEEFFGLSKPANRTPEAPRVMQDLYDGRVLDTDRLVGELVDGLEQRGLLENTIFVVIGDHAQLLGEHERYGHGALLWQDVLQIPFFIVDPREENPRVVQQRVNVVDMMPTILEMLGKEVPGGMQGRSLVPALRGESMEDQVSFAEVRIADPRQKRAKGQGEAVSVFEGPFKLTLQGDEVSLYHLGNDPGEMDPIPLEQQAEVVARLRPLANYHKQMPAGSITENGEMSAEMLAELQALGYVDGESGEGQ